MDLPSYSSALVIERPPLEEDLFSWNDFPAIMDDAIYLKTFATRSPDLPSLMEMCTSSDEDSYSVSLSSISDDDDDEEESIAASTTMVGASSTTTKSSATTSHRRVRFAPSIQIRTYSIILGDHPLCEALPISLGWEYDPQEAVVDLETHEDSKRMVQGGYYGHSSLAAAAHGVHRMSYLERKHLLLQVGGYTSEELDRVSSSFPTRLKHSKRSSSTLCLQEQQESFFAAAADV